ncbi:MAG: hypothetical protein EBQ92_03975 [Proteobacteria bacterium]|nr:hypothetical protein [Pseudomonadota bacterium]
MKNQLFLLYILILITSLGCGRRRTYYDGGQKDSNSFVLGNSPSCFANPSYALVHPQSNPDSVTTHQISLLSNMKVQIVDLRTDSTDFLSTDLASLSLNEKKDQFSFNLSFKNKSSSLTFLVENSEGTAAECTFHQARGIEEDGDLNGDGLIDMVRLLVDVEGRWSTHLFIRKSDGTFSENSLDTQFPLNDPIDRLILADLNNDGFKDVLVITKSPTPFVLGFRALVSDFNSSSSPTYSPQAFMGSWEGEPAQGTLSLDVTPSDIKLLGAINGKVFASTISLTDKTVSSPIQISPTVVTVIPETPMPAPNVETAPVVEAAPTPGVETAPVVEAAPTPGVETAPVVESAPAPVVEPPRSLSQLTQDRVVAQRESTQANKELNTASQQANTTKKVAQTLEKKVQKEVREADTAKTTALQKAEKAQKLLESVTQQGIPPLKEATQARQQAQKDLQKANTDLKKATQQQTASSKAVKKAELTAQKEDKQAQQALNKASQESEQARIAREKAAQQAGELRKVEAEKAAKAEEKQAEAARKKAEKEAREAEIARQKAEAARIKAEEAARIKAEKEAEAVRKKAELEEKKRQEAERKAQEKAARKKK